MRTDCEQNMLDWFFGPKEPLISLRKLRGCLLAEGKTIYYKKQLKKGVCW